MHYSIPKVYLPRPDRLYHELRSRRRRPEIDLAAVTQVLSKYDVELVAGPRVPPGGGRSRSLIVSTSCGKKLLKEYKQSLGQSTIIQEHAILTYLAQVEFPSPRLVAKNAGGTLVCQGEHRYALFDFIEKGFQYHNYVLFPGQARQFITIAGEMLAMLHDRLKDFAPQGHNPDGFRSQHSEDRWRNLEWILNKLTYCVAETPRLNARSGENQATWLLQQARYLEESLIQLDAEIREAALPRVIIHGDYGPYNLLFRENALPTILDFEMARLDWRVTEIIRAWCRFCYDRLGFRLSKMKWLLDAYQAHLPLLSDELRLVPAVWKLLDIRQCVIYWHRYCGTRAGSWLSRARRIMERVDWVMANQDELVANLEATNTRS